MATMIKNERQYRITRAQASKFESAMAEAIANPNRSLHPALRKAQVDGMKSQLQDLKKELRQDERLRSGKQAPLALSSIEELPKSLIQARIAAGLSQGDL